MINGLTDENTLACKQKTLYAAKVYKGKRRVNKQVGKDLEDVLRIVPSNKYIRKILLNSYQEATEDDNQDVLLPYINIYLANDRLDSTFPHGMYRWSASRLLAICDRATIQSQVEEYTDIFKQPQYRMVDCALKCPVADQGLGTDCPNGCTQEGTLHFYIPELIANGIELPCLLTVKAWTDISGIVTQLGEIASNYGSIKHFPFPCGSFGNIIPLTLSRVGVNIKRPVIGSDRIMVAGREKGKRTGKRTLGTAWAIALCVHPVWRKAFMAWQTADRVKAMGYAPDPKLLQSTGVIDVESLIHRALPPSPNGQIEYPQARIDRTQDEAQTSNTTVVLSQVQLDRLRQVLNTNWASVWGGKVALWQEAIASRFGVSKTQDIPASRFDEALELAMTGVEIEF